MSASATESVVIKKYANRRLYNTATSTYVTLENLAEMVKLGTEFNVYDAKSNDDITRSVLTQIIVEEEGKEGQNLLPIGFMRRLIGFYGNNMQWLVPKYLDHSLQSLTKNQGQIRDYFQTTFGSMFPFGSTLEEMSKQNIAMFERTMRMFSPFNVACSVSETDNQVCCTVTEGPATDACSCTTETKKTETKDTAETTCCSNVAELRPETTAKAEKTTAARSGKKFTAVPTPETTRATAQTASGDDVQNKIAALQRQLSELARNKA